MNKKHLHFGLIIFFVFALSCKNSTHEQIFRQYINGFNSGNYELIDEIVDDSIRIFEGDYQITSSKQELRTHFEWDKVFKPKYGINEIIAINESQSEFIVSKYCQRIEYLHDTAIVYKIAVIFNNEKIQEIKTTDYLIFDFEKWQNRRDTLVKWIDIHYPDLNNFINEQTQDGANNYLNAIELFRNQNAEK